MYESICFSVFCFVPNPWWRCTAQEECNSLSFPHLGLRLREGGRREEKREKEEEKGERQRQRQRDHNFRILRKSCLIAFTFTPK